MKKIILLMVLLFPLISFASDFSDLDNICFSKTDGQYVMNQDFLILKHINGRITKTNGYVKTNDYLYMVANTFTDNYRFLGSYLLSYDCKSHSTLTLSPLLKKNFSGELGFIQYDNSVNALMVRHSGINGATAVWIYDLETEKLKSINSRKIQAPKGYKISWNALLDTYDGDSIVIEKRYFTGNFQYTNLMNPDTMVYTF